jgi:hypothetical protein
MHDWECALTPTSNAPNSSGLVKVTAIADTNSFVVELAGLPPVDSLDQDGRDVNAYTIWVVPGKEREQVLESTLAGAVTIDTDGLGSLEGATTLQHFGVMVTATPDGAPSKITGIQVLSGIPILPESPEETEEQTEEVPGAQEDGTEPAEGAPAAVDEPDRPVGETPTGEETGPEPEPVEEPPAEDEGPAPAETEP